MAAKEFEYNPDIITVTDDNGVEHMFEELDRIESDDDKRYVALLPVYDESEKILEGDGDIIVLEVVEDEDGEVYLQQIMDEEEFNEIGEIMMKRIAEKYGFDED
ncbi:MAG: DUF1292 domain-containing protein [Ruminococcaceae bacterium]|nr:DUF1292 domain-containing protein [Oscillospiraceae bacterium]